ncbi:MAG: hypothetical protein ACXWEY_15985 [Bacteroidia bacterium]
MKFSDKYPQLKNRKYLAKMLGDTVYTTMALENQTVAMDKVREIVSTVLNKRDLKGGQSIADKRS